MRPEHKRYIAEHIGKKSIRSIARDLGIKEKSVERYARARAATGGPATAAATIQKGPRAPSPAGRGRAVPYALILLVAALTVFAYANSFHNDFIWDDEYLIRDNPSIRSLSHAKAIFGTYLAAASGNINNFYRPLQELSYMVDYRFWGDRVFGYHLTNTVLHALCAVLVYLVAFRALGSAVAAFVAAAVFGLHPINTEAVTYVAGRADPLYLFFALAALALFMASCETAGGRAGFRPLLYALSVASYAGAVLSKEIAVIVPALMLLYVLAFSPRGPVRTKRLWLAAPFVLIAVFYAFARSTFLDFSSVSPSFHMARYPLAVRLLTTCKAVTVYLGLLVFPVGLHMERRIAVFRSIADPQALVGLVLIAAMIAAAVVSFTRSRRAFFALTWFFIGLFPVSNIVPINSFIAEHWLYLPAIGLYLLLGIAVDNLWRRADGRFAVPLKAALAVSVATILGCYGVMTSVRNRDWRDEVTFFKSTLAYAPDNARLHLNFGNTYFERGEPDNALAEYEKAAALDPKDGIAHSNIAVIYATKRDLPQAKRSLDKALALKPGHPQALTLYGSISMAEGNLAAAEKYYVRALEAMPSYIDCRMDLADLYLRTGRKDKAVREWRTVLRIAPNNARAKELLATHSSR